MFGKIQRKCRVMNAHVVGDEVVRAGDGKVVDLSVAEGFDGDDAIPVNIAGREVPQGGIAECFSDAGKA